MKTIIAVLFILITALYSPRVMASAAEKTTLSNTTNASAAHNRDAMIKRVYEIRDMNFATLSNQQKKDLQQELLGIKQNLSGPDEITGLYLSSGVIIIILVVLLILALGKHSH